MAVTDFMRGLRPRSGRLPVLRRHGVAAPTRAAVARGLTLAGPVVCLAAVVVTATGAPGEEAFGRALFELLIVGVPMAAGIYALRAGTDARFALALIAFSLAWSLTALAETPASVPYTIGRLATWLLPPPGDMARPAVRLLPAARVPGGPAHRALGPAPLRAHRRPRAAPLLRLGVLRGGVPRPHAVGDVRHRLPRQRAVPAAPRAGRDAGRGHPAAGVGPVRGAGGARGVDGAPLPRRLALAPPHDAAGRGDGHRDGG